MIYFQYDPEKIYASKPPEHTFHRIFLANQEKTDSLGTVCHVYHSFYLKDHVSQKEGEIDFLIICKYGIAVIEIKGGLIKRENNQFFRYSSNGRNKKLLDPDPIEQVRDNKASIIKALPGFKLGYTFPVVHQVVFPDCDFENSDSQTEFIVGGHLNGFILIEQLKDVFKKGYADLTANRKLKIPKKELLSTIEVDRIAKLLVPKIDSILSKSKQLLISSDQQIENNKKVLRGLNTNPRTMIEAPYGGSKTVYVADTIVNKIESLKSRKILYLCWNELLASHTSKLLKDLDLDFVDVAPYYQFIQDTTGRDIAFDEDFGKIWDEFFSQVINQDKKLYDYIIIDEAQELFHQGLFEFIYYAFGKGDGVKNGNYTLFFDLAFHPNINHSSSNEVITEFVRNSAYFQISRDFRIAQQPEIIKFIEDCITNKFYLKYNKSGYIQKLPFDKTNEISHKIKDLFSSNNLKIDNTIVLYTSKILRKNQINNTDAIFNKIHFHELISFHAKPPNRLIQYTSALRYRGLEKANVILVCGPETTRDSSEFHQMMIGGSRSLGKLFILFQNS